MSAVTMGPAKTEDGQTLDCNFKGWAKFMSHYHKNKGPVTDKEHFAFLVFWLSRKIFCTPSKAPVREYISIAEALVAGRQPYIGPFVLAYIYRGCCQMVQNRLNTMVVGPLWVVQLWLYAYFPELAPRLEDLADANCTSYGHIYARFTLTIQSFERHFQYFYDEDRHNTSLFPFHRFAHGPRWFCQKPIYDRPPEDYEEQRKIWESYLVGLKPFWGHVWVSLQVWRRDLRPSTIRPSIWFGTEDSFPAHFP